MARKITFLLGKKFINESGGQVTFTDITEEEYNPEPQEDLNYQAYALESTNNCFDCGFNYPIDSNCSEFRFFEDGKQRTVKVGHIPIDIGGKNFFIPIHYFIVGSVILQKVDKELTLWEEPEISGGFFIAKSLLKDENALEKYRSEGLQVIDIQSDQADYYELRKRALQEAKKIRLKTEEKLISKWLEENADSSDFIVVDGTLMNLRNEKNVERCIGISKSFRSRYFSLPEHNKILQMKEFQRSWVFRFHTPDDDISRGSRERLSWYLRIRSKNNADIEFGLVRVEISRKHLDNFSNLVNRFSKSIISERLPATYPSSRWDKHLYPIQKCEDYLSSIIPSISTINSALMG